jgi:hypothetical protein
MEGHYEKLNKKLDKLPEKLKQPPRPDHKQQQNFRPRTVNLTNITFTKEEHALLELGLQYNIHQPLKKYWTNLIFETEKAIRLLEAREQHAFRTMAAKKLKQMYNTNHNTHNTYKRQQHILKNINHKLTTENAMITLADKSKATVIIYKHEYAKKVHTFLTDNNFHTLPDNPINKDQIRIQQTMQQCNQIIPKQHIKYLTQKTPTPDTKCITKTPQTRSPYPTDCKQQNRTLI